MQNTQYPMQNMQYQTKLSPSYPQSYPQKGVNPCKMCSTTCKIYSTPCKIHSTPCKICSTKQSYPQVIPKLSPELSPKRCYPMQNMQYPMQNTQYQLQNVQYPMQNTQYQLQNMQYHLQNTQYQTKLSPSYPQSYPQWISHRKIDLKNKSKCFILT